MALVRRERFEFPDFFRRLFDAEMEASFVRVEEFVDGETLVIRAELPGIDPDKDVELTIDDDILHLRAEREEKVEHKEKDAYRSEFRYGSFARSIPLPAGSTAEDIAATYTDGVLEIRVPVQEQAKSSPTKVAITRG
jgi:HSP20 family protein